jgi:hypothetical protein
MSLHARVHVRACVRAYACTHTFVTTLMRARVCARGSVHLRMQKFRAMGMHASCRIRVVRDGRKEQSHTNMREIGADDHFLWNLQALARELKPAQSSRERGLGWILAKSDR